MPTMLKLAPLLLLALALAQAQTNTAWADNKADRGKPMTLESDQPCTLDLAKQVSVCSGNVVIAQGSLQIRAERIELRETPDGWRRALAVGNATKPATYRQRRAGTADEEVQGQAERIEYDGRTNTLKFVGGAAVRRLKAGTVADEIQGAQITWDNTAELFSVQGGAPSAGNPGGRVRAVLAPREGNEAPASAPAASLRPSGQIGARK